MKRSHTKAAHAVKKAAKDIITLDDAVVEGPQLDTIVEEWRRSRANKEMATDALSYVINLIQACIVPG